MNKSEIFSAAHYRAKTNKRNFKSYRAAFAAALKAEYAIHGAGRKFQKLDVWSNNAETRYYITFQDGKQGVYYRTGNPWNKKGTLEGMKSTDLERAEKIMKSKKQGFVSAIYPNQLY